MGDALPQLLVVTPHFFLHNFWHLLPAMPALSILERESHTHRHAWRILQGKAQLRISGAEAMDLPMCQSLLKACCTVLTKANLVAHWVGTGEGGRS